MNFLNRKIVRTVLCMLMVLSCLAGCAQDDAAEPTVPQWKWLREKAEYLTVPATLEDFALLEECVNLEYLDLTGSTCYDSILKYIAEHPQVEVRYTAPLGSLMLSNLETEAALEPGTYSLEALLQELPYLPNLNTLTLPKTTLTPQALATLQEGFPELKLVYSVVLLGEEYLTNVTELDLSGMQPEQLEEVCSLLSLLPDVAQVELMDSSGNSALGMADVKQLMQALPQAQFHYTFDLFGKTVSTMEERVEFEDQKIGDEGQQLLRDALAIMPNCTYLRLEDCGFSNEVLGSIQAEYPNTKIAWRVYFGGQYSVMTDEDTLRTVYGVYNSHAETLKYLTSLKYIDMGHNTELTDISFTAYMPDLEILILSGSPVKDLTPLANCKKLVWLELAECRYIEDISPLEACESLRFLNISFAKVRDLSPIEALPLERFVYLDPQLDEETQTAFQESHPDCWVRFTGTNPLSLGWKYDDVGMTYSEYFKFIREVFDLDSVDARLAAQAAAEEEKKWQEEQENAGSGETAPPAETAPPVTEAPAPPATEPPAPAPDAGSED